MLPRTYGAKPRRRYPVVYLLHGVESYAEEYVRCMRLLELTANDEVIVVLPQGTPSGFWIDWHSGEQLRESALLEMIESIDHRFRTIAKRSGRAIGGLSMGGYGAMVQAGRHPELYTAAASFSGALGSAISDPAKSPLVYALESVLAPGAFADPVTPDGREWRAAHDPIALAGRLRGMSIFLASGTGVPCDQSEVESFSELDPTEPTMEPLFRDDQNRMHEALSAARIQHISREYDCGAHTYVTFARALEDAWPGLMSSLDRATVDRRRKPHGAQSRKRKPGCESRGHMRHGSHCRP